MLKPDGHSLKEAPKKFSFARRPGFWVALLAAFFGSVHALHADVVIFKDGFVVQGKVTREGERITDRQSGQTIYAQKGPFYVEDGVRKISFGHTHVQHVDNKGADQAGEIVKITVGSPGNRIANYPAYPVLGILDVSDWNKRWQRIFKMRTLINGQMTTISVEQRLGLLTPQIARVDALKYVWSAYYQTNELGIEQVRSLLEDHPDLQMKNDKSDIERRFKIARFFRQAGWFAEADKELDRLLKDFSAEKQRVTEMRDQLKSLMLLRAVEDLEHAQQARRHAWLQKQLALFPKEGVDDAVLTRVRALTTKYEFINDALCEAQKYLKELPEQLKDSPTKTTLQQAAATILTELNEDNVGRLEPFRSFARQRKGDSEKDPAPEQILSLAVSGWLLGKESADMKVDVARRLWNARAMVLKYLSTHDRDIRDEVLNYYQQKKEEAVAFDELAQLVRFLPPPEPEKLTGLNPLELSTTSYTGKKNGLRYLLQVPPEYHHARAYPVLIALHQVGEGPKQMIARCSLMAARHGYLLAAPEWTDGSTSPYHYSAEEHAAVINVLRDLKRRFQVDSDRVFVLGAGEGGAMAMDVGLSHPDLFAGIIPVSAYPQMFSVRYAYAGNAQNLPFYLVNGTQAGKQLVDQTKAIFDKWIPQQFPALHVEYNGRGLEWFGVELPAMFDWMNRKKRATGYPNVGRFDFLTLRETDNSFYWLTADALRPGAINDARNWKSQVLGANLHGSIAEGNQVRVKATNLLRVTVWLGRDSVDFTKPVTFRINGSIGIPKTVKPSPAVLLEDLYQRGDRQHVFLAKESFDLK